MANRIILVFITAYFFVLVRELFSEDCLSFLDGDFFGGGDFGSDFVFVRVTGLTSLCVLRLEGSLLTDLLFTEVLIGLLIAGADFSGFDAGAEDVRTSEDVLWG
jgi:hypothetical protein